MLLTLTPDQEFFRSTTAKFLDDRMPVAEVRRRRHDAAGFDPDYWRRGAELGWTALLVSEEHGGGSISGDGIVDATIVAYEFGRHAAPGPLVPTNVVAGALSAGGTHLDVLESILGGTSVATWCFAERHARAVIDIGLDIRSDGNELVLRGEKRPVESAAEATHLLVTGRADGGLTQVLVPADAPGVTITPMTTVDLTRRFSVVAFDDVRISKDAVVGLPGKAEEDVERQLQQALALVNAESVGAMQTGFDMTVQWAFDRFSFGRPLASYQALKHRFADMKSWLEGGHAISDEAARAVAAGSPDAGTMTSAAKAFVGDFGGELLQDCVQIHGGLGVTFEHDIHLYLRRHAVNRALYGTPAQHRQRLADIAEKKEKSA